MEQFYLITVYVPNSQDGLKRLDYRMQWETDFLAYLKKLEEKILKEGKVLPGNILKVTSFLNHRLDVDFLMEMGKEIARLFENEKVDKILTVETSGIAIAVAAAAQMHLPVVFAKKHKIF